MIRRLLVALALLGLPITACTSEPTVEEVCARDFIPDAERCRAGVERSLQPCRNRDSVLRCYGNANDLAGYEQCEDMCWTDLDHAREQVRQAAEGSR